jgi:GTP-binding protein
VHFKSSVKTTPLEAEYGGFGEQKLLQFELKLLADLGLVGLPNAGKSTFLAKMTKANPKIANYPFTTIEPNLGIMHLGANQSKEELVIADIPGLIEGAAKARVLGLDFLRHIENCQVLYVCFVLRRKHHF